jgi:group I intron endonuclease
MPTCCYVYLITNTINGKQYVGFTSNNVETRWKAHSKGGPDSARKLHAAILKYGANAFRIETVFQGTKDEALSKEHELIIRHDTFVNGYNGSEGGEAPYLGKTTPPEVRAKISESLKGNKFNLGKKASTEARSNMSRAHLGNRSNLGRVLPLQHRQNISKALKGKRLGIRISAEQIEKQRAAMTGRTLSAEHRAKISAGCKGNKNGLGYRHTAETRAKMSAERKASGRMIGNKIGLGKTHSLETKAKMRASALLREARKRGEEC